MQQGATGVYSKKTYEWVSGAKLKGMSQGKGMQFETAQQQARDVKLGVEMAVMYRAQVVRGVDAAVNMMTKGDDARATKVGTQLSMRQAVEVEVRALVLKMTEARAQVVMVTMAMANTMAHLQGAGEVALVWAVK
jgi:hypothetical protein